MSLLRFLFSRSFLINLIIMGLVVVLAYIILIISLGQYTRHLKNIEVPNLRGLTYADAQEFAQQSGLKVKIIDTVYSNEAERGLIAAQVPAMGSKVKEDRTIYLTINSSQAEMIAMPNLIGASLRQAIADASVYGFKIGELNYVPDIAKNNVLEQQIDGENIPVGQMIEKGSKIDLTLGLGIDNESVSIPFLLYKTLDEADSILSSQYVNTGAKFYDEHILTAEDSAKAFVYQQEPEPFSKDISPGKFVDLWFTLDSNKVLIKEEWLLDSTYVGIDTSLIRKAIDSLNHINQ